MGNGDDVDFLIKNKKNLNLKIYTQDLSEKFITHCYKRFHKKKNIFYNLSNAKNLPFKDNVFDHTYHFGGINLFGNIKKSINEMFRVTKDLGSINFGDEGVIGSVECASSPCSFKDISYRLQTSNTSKLFDNLVGSRILNPLFVAYLYSLFRGGDQVGNGHVVNL